MQEVDDVADRVILFHRGSVVADGTPDEIKGKLSNQIISFYCDKTEFEQAIKQIPHAKKIYEKKGKVYIETDNSDAVVESIYRNKLTVRNLSIEQGRLEEAFEQLTTDEKGAS